MCQVFGGLPCESRRTFADPAACRARISGRRGTFNPGPELLALELNGPPHRNRNFVTSFLDPLIAFVSAHAWLAYLTLFLAALLEAVPVVGALVPGSTIILALSALVPGGELNLWGVLAAAIAGALIGDGSAFWSAIARSAKSSAPGRCPIIPAWWRRARRSSIAGARWRCSLPASCRRSAPSCRSRRARSGCRRCSSTASTFPRSCVWALAHVLPGVLAVSALHEYAGLPHHEHVGKHLWMLAVIGGALIVAFGVWTIRRRHGGGVIEPAKK